MKIGISTASLFGKLSPKDALWFFREQNVQTAEVFLQSFCEYNKNFAKKLIKNINVDIHSIHVLTTQFEPTLYSLNSVAQKDSFKILDGVLGAGKALGAKCYTFHGGARFKRTQTSLDINYVSKITNQICERANKHGLSLAYENVHWGYYNYVGFFKQIKKQCPLLKATLDIKQARQSDLDVKDFILDMEGSIETVHLSDVDKYGKMCLPGKGETDFSSLFSMLKDTGFDGALIIEVYGKDYEDKLELIESLNYLKEIHYKIF